MLQGDSDSLGHTAVPALGSPPAGEGARAASDLKPGLRCGHEAQSDIVTDHDAACAGPGCQSVGVGEGPKARASALACQCLSAWCHGASETRKSSRVLRRARAAVDSFKLVTAVGVQVEVSPLSSTDSEFAAACRRDLSALSKFTALLKRSPGPAGAGGPGPTVTITSLGWYLNQSPPGATREPRFGLPSQLQVEVLGLALASCVVWFLNLSDFFGT
jgi:hypothetical protein